MDDLKNDPEYVIRWPNDLLADELDKLIARGHSSDCGGYWNEEVEALIRQAFTSNTPLDEWNRALNSDFTDKEPF